MYALFVRTKHCILSFGEHYSHRGTPLSRLGDDALTAIVWTSLTLITSGQTDTSVLAGKDLGDTMTIGAQPSRYASPISGPHQVEVAESWRLERVTAPSRLFGANGLRTGPDGRVYIAQVTGSQISALDHCTGQL
jgi:hypothetical protein